MSFVYIVVHVFVLQFVINFAIELLLGCPLLFPCGSNRPCQHVQISNNFQVLCASVQNASGTLLERPTTLEQFRTPFF